MLPDLIKFIDLTNRFQKVKRTILVRDEEFHENDAEHSYQVAFAAWYIIETQKLDLDLNKIFKYSILHDLVEVYAGDTFIYSTDEDLISSKEERELQAAERLKEEFPEFEELYSIISSYEKREDAESKFVYALDKILPILNIYLDNGRTWKRLEITLDMLFKHKKDKVAVSPEIALYFNQIIEVLRERDDLFKYESEC